MHDGEKFPRRRRYLGEKLRIFRGKKVEQSMEGKTLSNYGEQVKKKKRDTRRAERNAIQWSKTGGKVIDFVVIFFLLLIYYLRENDSFECWKYNLYVI